MNTTSPAAVPALVLRRTYDTTPERLFSAWTTPEIAARFLGPGEVKATAEMDVRPGGSYRIAMHRPEGDVWIAKGQYREVSRPHRLAMTWRWEEDNPADEHESLLTLEFNEVAGGTELVLTHEKLSSLESREGHAEGWGLIVEQLESVL
jgi:uncharacterized protein YndB with AHSA1/START domain